MAILSSKLIGFTCSFGRRHLESKRFSTAINHGYQVWCQWFVGGWAIKSPHLRRNKTW
jgi:hypothetical protein